MDLKKYSKQILSIVTIVVVTVIGTVIWNYVKNISFIDTTNHTKTQAVAHEEQNTEPAVTNEISTEDKERQEQYLKYAEDATAGIRAANYGYLITQSQAVSDPNVVEEEEEEEEDDDDNNTGYVSSDDSDDEPEPEPDPEPVVEPDPVPEEPVETE